MQIVKKRLKKSLSNKIFKNQLTPFTLLYTVIDSSQTLTKEFPKKAITKTLLNNNFKVLKKTSFIYPLYYFSSNTFTNLTLIYNKLKQHPDFKKIIICNIKVNSLFFKNFTLISTFNIDNPLNVFTKIYFLLNPWLKNFIIVKKNKVI